MLFLLKWSNWIFSEEPQNGAENILALVTMNISKIFISEGDSI